VVITTGTGYGRNGAGYFQAALTIEKERIKEELNKISGSTGKVEF
jgi:hypothetical protein